MKTILQSVVEGINHLLSIQIPIPGLDLVSPEVDDPFLYQVLRASHNVTQFDAALRLLQSLPPSVRCSALLQRARYYPPIQYDEDEIDTEDELLEDYEAQLCRKGIMKLCLEECTQCMPALIRFALDTFLSNQHKKPVLHAQQRQHLYRLFYLDYDGTQKLYDLFLYDLSSIRDIQLLPTVLPYLRQVVACIPTMLVSPKMKAPYFFAQYAMSPIYFAHFLHFYLDCLSDHLIAWSAVSDLLFVPSTHGWRTHYRPLLHHLIAQSEHHGGLSHVTVVLQRLQRIPGGKRLCIALFEQHDCQGNTLFMFGIKYKNAIPILRIWAHAYLRWVGRAGQPILSVLYSRRVPYILPCLANHVVHPDYFEQYLKNLCVFLPKPVVRMLFNQYFSDGISIFSQMAQYSPAVLTRFLTQYFYLYRCQPGALNTRLASDFNPVPLLHLFLLTLYGKPDTVAIRKARRFLQWVTQLSPRAQVALWERTFLKWRVLEMAALVPGVFPLFLQAALSCWQAQQSLYREGGMQPLLGLAESVSDRAIIVLLLMYCKQLGRMEKTLYALLTLPPHALRALWEQKYRVFTMKTGYAWDKRGIDFKWKSRYRRGQSVSSLEIATVSAFSFAVVFKWMERARQHYNNTQQGQSLSWARTRMLSHTTLPIGMCLLDRQHSNQSLGQLHEKVTALFQLGVAPAAIRALLSAEWTVSQLDTTMIRGELRIFIWDVKQNSLLIATKYLPAFYALLTRLKQLYLDAPYALLQEKQAQKYALRYYYHRKGSKQPASKHACIHFKKKAVLPPYTMQLAQALFPHVSPCSPPHPVLLRKRPCPLLVRKRTIAVLSRRWTREIRQLTQQYQWGKQQLVRLLRADRSRMPYPLMHRLVTGMLACPRGRQWVSDSVQKLQQCDTQLWLALLLQKNMHGRTVIGYVAHCLPQLFHAVVAAVVPTVHASSISQKQRRQLWCVLFHLDTNCVPVPILHRLVRALSFPDFRLCLHTLFHRLPHWVCDHLFRQKAYYGNRIIHLLEYFHVTLTSPTLSPAVKSDLIKKAQCVLRTHAALVQAQSQTDTPPHHDNVRP